MSTKIIELETGKVLYQFNGEWLWHEVFHHEGIEYFVHDRTYVANENTTYVMVSTQPHQPKGFQLANDLDIVAVVKDSEFTENLLKMTPQEELEYWRTQATLANEEFNKIKVALQRVIPVGSVISKAVERLADKYYELKYKEFKSTLGEKIDESITTDPFETK